MFNQRTQVFRSFLFLNDFLVLTLCWFGAYFLRFFAPLIPVTKGIPPLADYLYLAPLVLLIGSGTLTLTGIYSRFYNRTQEGVALFKATFILLMVLVFITFFFKRTDYSRLVFLYFSLLSFFFLIGTRLLFKKFYLRLQRRTFGQERVLIVGARELAQRVAQTIGDHPELGLSLAGFLTRIPQKVGTRLQGVEILGLYENLDRIIPEHHINLVIFAMPLTAQHKLEELLNLIRDELVDIKIVPDLYRLISLRGGLEEFEGLPFINLRESPLVGWNRFLKWALDMVLAALFLVLLSPLLILIALAIKLTSPGPLIYRQTRMGLDGKVFAMWKFRSMRVDAEEETGPVWARPQDPRRTPVGRFLRRFSLDELPQLFNVLKGEMSLVGPRPERPELIREFKDHIPNYMLRHTMKAGMTGWAQINGWRGNTSLQKRIECDLYYIENWSLLFDVKILIKTLWKGFFSREAY